MKLIQIYIQNFGCLHEFTHQFSDGVNVILKENGFGKTTMCDFIRAMFYGLNDNSKKSVLENDRKHYLPWQGGTCGGYLIFEAEGKQYRIERTFGKKPSEDTCIVRDLQTGNETTAFGDNVGMALFAVDKESFTRSILIPQAPSSKDYTMTDSINVRLTNMLEGGSETDSFEQAVGRLDEAMKYYKKEKGNGGKIPELLASAQGMNAKIAALEKLQEQLTQKNQEHRDLLEEEQTAREQLANCKLLLKEAGSYGMNVIKAKRYNDLKSRLGEHQSDRDALMQELFASGIPTKEELEAMKGTLKDRIRVAGQLESMKIAESDQEKYNQMQPVMTGLVSAEHVSISEQVTKAETLLEQAQENRTAYLAANNEKTELARAEAECNALKAQFKHSNHEEDLARVKRFDTDIKAIDAETKQHEGNKAEYEKQLLHYENDVKVYKRTPTIAGFAVGGIVIMLIGAILATLFKQYALYGLIVVGVLMLVYALMAKKDVTENEKKLALKKQEIKDLIEKEQDAINLQAAKRQETFGFVKLMLRQYEIQDVDNDLEVLEDTIRSNFDAYLDAKNRMEDLNRKQSDNEERVKLHQRQYEQAMAAFAKIKPELEQPEERLAYLKIALERYALVNDQMFEKQVLEEQLASLNAEIGMYFNGRFPMVEASLDGIVKLEKAKEALEITEQKLAEVKKDYDTFVLDNDIEAILRIASLDAPDEAGLRMKESELELQLQKLSTEITQNQLEVRDLEEQLLQRADLEQTLSQTMAELEDAETQYRQLRKAKELLQKAREEFAVRYKNRIADSFLKLMQKLDEHTQIAGVAATEGTYGYHMDNKLEVTVEQCGGVHELDYMSAGYRDLVCTCMRFALVDAMYEQERPFVILDDPMVNLDAEKLLQFKLLLGEIAMDHQIIYLTCHQSRC